MTPADVLPDCSRCGGRVVLDTDLPEGPVEICEGCGLGQSPMPDLAGIVTAVRERRTRRLLGPSCSGRRHAKCSASGCQCTCHDKGDVRVAS